MFDQNAGLLGYVAFHVTLVCDFDTIPDERRLADIWQHVLVGLRA